MEEAQLPDSVNPESFPAKLWLLVNSPRFCSIHWDAGGQGLLIDEKQFVWEVLDAGPGRGPGPAGDGAARATSLFKTKSFTSFIRQLNLYGFHRVAKGPVVEPRPGPGPEAGGEGGGGSVGFVHHFHSPHFCRGRPDLLVHLKRLTKANKAKLAAGLELTSRLPRRLPTKLLRRDLRLPPSTLAKANGPGLLTVGQFLRPYGQDRFFACSYLPTSTQIHGTSPTGSLNPTPVSSVLWQSSLQLLPGPGASPAFPHKGIAFPRLQSCVTEVTYTLRPVTSILPLHQESQSIATSLPDYSSSSPSVQYSQAYCPTAALQCCSPPAHTDLLPGSASPAASTYTRYGFFPDTMSVECESSVPEIEDSQFTSVLEPVKKSIEETDPPVEPRCRKRRHASDKDQSPDLHLLEGRACKQGYFSPKEEAGE